MKMYLTLNLIYMIFCVIVKVNFHVVHIFVDITKTRTKICTE